MRRHMLRLPGLLTGMTIPVIVILLLELAGLQDPLEYRRSVLLREPWRLLSAHFVHLSLVHALLNAVALLLLARLFAGRLRNNALWMLLLGTPIPVSLALWIAVPGLEWYRGLSGVLHAVFFAGCIVWLRASTGRSRWLPIAALLAGAAKVLLEQPWDASFPFREWLGAAIVPQAHLAGALIGTAAGLGFAASEYRRMTSAKRV